MKKIKDKINSELFLKFGKISLSLSFATTIMLTIVCIFSIWGILELSQFKTIEYLMNITEGNMTIVSQSLEPYLEPYSRLSNSVVFYSYLSGSFAVISILSFIIWSITKKRGLKKNK